MPTVVVAVVCGTKPSSDASVGYVRPVGKVMVTLPELDRNWVWLVEPIKLQVPSALMLPTDDVAALRAVRKVEAL